VLRENSRFRQYFFGSAVSDFGTWLQNTAQVLLAYQLAHSVFTVGLVTFAQFTSPLLLAPWAGVAADRFGGRNTLLGTQIISASVAATLAGLDFGGCLNALVLIVGAIISGLAFTFALPARNVTVQQLVLPSKLKPAYAMDSVSYNLGRAIAPLLTMGMVLLGISFAWAFAANAVSFIAFSLILLRVRVNREEQPERRSRVWDGFVIASKDGRIMILLLMVAAVTIADDPILVLGPALAKQLNVSPAWSGWFIAALGTGTVCGSFRRSKHQPNLRLAATSLAFLAVFMLFFVWAPMMRVGLPSIYIGVAAALGAGASCLVANSVTRAVLAEHAGPKKTAAVMAVWAIAWAGSKPFASLIDGALGSSIGPQWTGVILAVPAFIPIVVVALLPATGLRFARLKATAPELQPSSARWRRAKSLKKRYFAKSLASPDTPVSSRQTNRYAEKTVDDNIAHDRHNWGMADSTPTKS
jgi:MFS family permease